MDEGTREQLKVKYPNEKLHFIRSAIDGIEIVVTGAPPAVWAKYKSLSGALTDGLARMNANKLLVLGSMVHPGADESGKQAFDAELERRKLQGFYTMAASEVREITGERNQLEVGEL